MTPTAEVADKTAERKKYMIRLFQAEQHETLMQVIQREGVPLNAPCGGNHSCGKCRVRILAGEIHPPRAEEVRMLSQQELSEGWRLACAVEGPGAWQVEVPSQDGGARVLTDGSDEDNIPLDPASTVRRVQIEKPSLEDARCDAQRVIGDAVCPLPLLRTLSAAVHTQREVYVSEFDGFGVQSCSAQKVGNLGVAVDVGTTTMAAYLIDLESGKQMGCTSRMNPQRSFGGDVISRADYACESAENLDRLQKIAVGAIEKMTEKMLSQCGKTKDDVRHIVCVGNTIMMHLLAGLETGYITRSPFTPVYRRSLTVKAHELGMSFEQACVTLGACVAGYVGADTVAAVLACGMHRSDKLSLLIDIGTNGEIVLGSREKMLCCSAAAGPAFEGAHIRCGSGAQDGAVDHVEIKNGEVSISVLGGGEAKSICGSGLVDAIAQMIEAGIIDETGRIDEDEIPEEYEDRLFDFEDNPAFSLSGDGENGVFISQQDIREVQLAKAAIAAGVEVLVGEMGITFDQIDKLYLAGGFGNYIDRESAVVIGLLPKEMQDRIIPVGNAAGTGARMMLKNRGEWKLSDTELLDEMRYVELSARADFQNLFVDKMMFGDEEY